MKYEYLPIEKGRLPIPFISNAREYYAEMAQIRGSLEESCEKLARELTWIYQGKPQPLNDEG